MDSGNVRGSVDYYVTIKVAESHVVVHRWIQRVHFDVVLHPVRAIDGAAETNIGSAFWHQPTRAARNESTVAGKRTRIVRVRETLAEITRALEHISSAHYIGGFKMVPQIVYLLLLALGLGITMEQHGKPKTGKHNFWVSLIAAALSFAIVWWGGFFNVFFK